MSEYRRDRTRLFEQFDNDRKNLDNKVETKNDDDESVKTRKSFDEIVKELYG